MTEKRTIILKGRAVGKSTALGVSDLAHRLDLRGIESRVLAYLTEHLRALDLVSAEMPPVPRQTWGIRPRWRIHR